ncbi:MAG: toxin-antitoxin system TumE family protein [Gammaproteobacteria bacterium]
MKAIVLYRGKTLLASGAVVEMVIWKLPAAEPERPHGFKYRLYYGRAGRRLVSYDNERGKGDHRHIGGLEMPYQFVTVDRLIDDFLEDVARKEAEDA